MREPQTKKPRFFYGWYIVAGAFFGNWLGGGLGVPVFGLFFKPMAQELGWTRTGMTWPLVARAVLSQVTAPVVGPLLDRFGPRYLMTIGALVAGLGTVLMSQVNSAWQFFLFFSVIGALGNAGLGFLVTNTAVAKWFVRKRGRATAIANTGINVGEGSMTPLAHLLIASMGWRGAWMVLGLVPWLIIAPASFILMRRAPEDMGLRPDGLPLDQGSGSDAQVGGGPQLDPSGEYPWTPGEAFRTPVLWVLVVVLSLAGLSVSGVVVHQLPFLTDQGLSQGTAAMSLTLYAAFAIPSKLIWGYLAERIHIRYLTAACLLGSGGGLLILLRADTVAEAAAFGIVYGLARGSWAVVMALIWADYFGRHFLGTIRGYVTPITLLSSQAGPLLAAFVFDSTQSYHPAFWAFVVSYVLAALLVLMATPPAPSRTASAGMVAS